MDKPSFEDTLPVTYKPPFEQTAAAPVDKPAFEDTMAVSQPAQEQDQGGGVLSTVKGLFGAAIGKKDWETPESKQITDNIGQSMALQNQVDTIRPEVMKDSAFEHLQALNAEISDATRGIHADPNTLKWSRYVDQQGSPIDTRAVESEMGQQNPMDASPMTVGGLPEGVHEEPILDYFVPGLRGKPAPYFQSHEVNQSVAAAFDSGDPTFLQSMKSEWLGAKTLVTDPQRTGFYKYLFGPLSEAEQGVARTATYALSKIGQIPPEDAKKMLSQEELHNHDIVDYFGLDSAEGASHRLGLAATGFLTDFIDPAMWMGTAQKVTKYGASAVEYGGRMITDFGQISRMEATHFKLGYDVERIISEDGKMFSPGLTQDASNSARNSNLEALDKFKDAGMVPTDGSAPFTFNDLQGELNLSPDANAALNAARDARMQAPSVLKNIASGDRQLALKIPFTNTALEVPFISDAVRWGGQGAAEAILAIKNGTGRTLESLDRMVAAQGAIGQGTSDAIHSVINTGNWIASKMGQFATDTSRPIFNAASRIFTNDQSVARYQANAFKDTWYKMFMGEDGRVNGDDLKEVMNLLDIEPQRDNAFYAEQHGLSEEEVAAKLDPARAQAQQMRSTMSANQIKLTEEIQKQNIMMVDAMRSRGIPFFEINPLEEGNQTTGYVKHMMTKEYLSQYKNTGEAIDAARDFSQTINAKADGSQLERTLKIPIARANAEYAAANDGMKMFVEDPIAAHTARMKEMQDQIRNHDLMHTLDDLAIYSKEGEGPGQGFVKFDPETMGQSPMLVQGQGENPYKDFTQFLPDKMKTWLDLGNEIHFPEDVSTRLQYLMNPHANSGPLGGLMNNGVAKTMQYLFRNTALFGPGYLGMRFFSHLATVMYSGTDLARVFDAMHVITPAVGDAEKMFQIGGETMSKSQLFELAQQHGILHTGFMMDDDWGKIVENIASVSKERDGIGKTAMTVFDHANLFSANRAISSGIDDIGKMAHFMTQLDRGYTPAGAAESAEFWFYNFTQKSQAQNLASAIIPFSTTGIKTMEQTLTALKEMNIAHLTLPEKVNSVLSGNYIGSSEERRFIGEVIPNWQKSNIYGPMLPGARELVMEFPWVYHTMNFITQPFTAERDDQALPVSPLLKLPLIAWSAEHADSQADFGDQTAWSEAATTVAANFLPPIMKHALTMYQIQHPEENHLVNFKSWYVPRGFMEPTKGNDTNTMQKVGNAKEFGNWMESKYGDNAIMNLWLRGTPEEKKGPPTNAIEENLQNMYQRREDAISAGLGNYVRARMRDLTFGISRATALDNDVLSRNAALGKQAKAVQGQFLDLQSRTGMGLVAPDALTNPEVRANILQTGTAQEKTLVAQHEALLDKISALHQFYGQVLKDNQEKTGIFRQIFGLEPNKVQFTSQPHGLESLNSKVNFQNIMQEQGE